MSLMLQTFKIMSNLLDIIRWILVIALMIIMIVYMIQGDKENAILAGVLALINKPSS